MGRSAIRERGHKIIHHISRDIKLMILNFITGRYVKNTATAS